MVVAAAIVVSLASIQVPLAPAIETSLLAQGGARPAIPQAPRSGRNADAVVPFHVGETLTYDILLSSFLVAGSAYTSVTDKKTARNSAAYSLVAEGKPVAAAARLLDLGYRLDTLLDSVTLLADQGMVSSDTGSRHETSTTTFDRAGPAEEHRAMIEQADAKRALQAIELPDHGVDGAPGGPGR